MKKYGGILIAYAAIVVLGAGAIALLTKQYIIALAVLGILIAALSALNNPQNIDTI